MHYAFHEVPLTSFLKGLFDSYCLLFIDYL
jgi:hypothetical protein